MAIRVVHWGTGQTGRAALRGIIGHPDLELVGLVVERKENVGRDAGEICGMEATGVISTTHVDDILALAPDCLSYFGSGAMDLNVALTNLLPFLRSGCSVVTTSLSAFIHPHTAPETARSAVKKACEEGGASFFATGIEPGFASDLLPLTLLTVVDEIRCVHMQEIATYRRYGVEDMMRLVFGFGQPPDYDIPLFSPGFLTQQWGGPVLGIGAALGIEFDEMREFHERVVTVNGVDTAFGRVEAGTIAGIRFGVAGIYKGSPLAIIEHVNHVDESAAPDWPRGADGKDTVYKIRIDGKPALRCELDLDCVDGEEQGLVATAMRAVNAIPVVHEAAPGILDVHDVPARTGRNVLRSPNGSISV